MDALYVATAVLVGAPTVYTWDERLLGISYRDVNSQQPPGMATPKLDLG